MTEHSGGSSPDLRLPLKRELRDPVSEAQVFRIWRGIEARRGAPRAKARSVAAWTAIGALAGVAVMLTWEALRVPPHRESAAASSRRDQPLVLRSGKPIEPVEVESGAPSRSFALSDGSHFELDSGARLEPLVASASDVVLRLVIGRAVFDVVPGGPRRWVVEAGMARVEVVGTRFAVTRTADRVHVAVERGVVLVRGATVPDGVGRVEAGSSLDVYAARASGAAGVTDRSNGSSQTPQAAAHPSSAWRASAARGRYAEAYVTLGSGGVGRETARVESPEDLLALADIARLSGHPAEAVEPLQRILKEHPSSPSAPLSALTLGRIQLALDRPAEATRSLERALSLHVPGGLEEDLYARLVEAYGKAGDAPGARAAAREYLRRFPGGRRSADVLRWSEE